MVISLKDKKKREENMKFLTVNNNSINFMDKFLIFLTDVPYVIFGAVNSIFNFYIYNSGNKN